MIDRLILVRHGSAGIDHRFRGRTDTPLDDLGVMQVGTLKNALADFEIGKAFVSPILRTRQTAKAIGQNFEILENLQEVDFGQWDGLTFDEISQRWPGLVDKWSQFDLDFAFPGGESLRDFTARVGACADDIINSDAKTVLAVTHGGVIRSMICHLLGLGAQNYLLFNASVASISIVNIFPRGKGTLQQLNCTAHLHALKKDKLNG